MSAKAHEASLGGIDDEVIKLYKEVEGLIKNEALGIYTYSSTFSYVVDIFKLYGHVLCKETNYLKAKEIFDQIFDLTKNYEFKARSLYAEGCGQLKNNQLVLAVKKFDEALSLASAESEVYKEILEKKSDILESQAEVLFGQDKYSEAVDKYSELYGLNHENSYYALKLYSAKGFLKCQEKDSQGAIKFLEEALDIAEKEGYSGDKDAILYKLISILETRGDNLYEEGDYVHAMDNYIKVLDLDFDHKSQVRLLSSEGYIFLKDKEYEKAVAKFRAALNKVDKFVECQSYKNHIEKGLTEALDLSDARSVQEGAYTVTKKDTKILVAESFELAKKGQYEKALKILDKIAADNSNPELMVGVYKTRIQTDLYNKCKNLDLKDINPKEVIELCDQALKLLVTDRNYKDEIRIKKVTALKLLASELRKSGLYEEAIKAYDEVLGIALKNQNSMKIETLKGIELSIQTWIEWGDSLCEEGKYDDAAKKFKEAFDLSGKSCDESLVLTAEGIRQLQIKNYSEAFEKFKNALGKEFSQFIVAKIYDSIAKIFTDETHAAHCDETEAVRFSNLGKIFYEKGQLQKAVELYDLFLPIIKSDNVRKSLENNKAAVLNLLGEQEKDLAKAREIYEQASEFAHKESTKSKIQNNILNCIDREGQKLINQKKYDEASNLYISSGSMGDVVFQAKALHAQGLSLQASDNKEALGKFDEALDLLKDNPSAREIKNSKASILNILGKEFIEQRRYDEALSLFKQAGELATNDSIKSITNIHKAEVLKLKGKASYEEGEHTVAIKLYDEALRLTKKFSARKEIIENKIIALVMLGDQHIEQGEFSKAAANYQKAHELSHKFDYKALALNAEACELLQNKKYFKALQNLEQALKVPTSKGFDKSFIEDNKAFVFIGLEEYDNALKFARSDSIIKLINHKISGLRY